MPLCSHIAPLGLCTQNASSKTHRPHWEPKYPRPGSVGGLHQWLQQKAKQSPTRTRGNDKCLSSRRPQGLWAKHQSWSCQTAQIHVVASCTKVQNDTRQIEHVCIANSMCFMGLISFPFGSSQVWCSQCSLDTQKSLEVDSLSYC